jgi:hypothetical protein
MDIHTLDGNKGGGIGVVDDSAPPFGDELNICKFIV